MQSFFIIKQNEAITYLHSYFLNTKIKTLFRKHSACLQIEQKHKTPAQQQEIQIEKSTVSSAYNLF